MTTAADHNFDAIPESRAARWAWRVSLIPLLGVPLFILLAFLALYRIGSKGRTGFWLLRRGVIAVLLLTVVPYFGLYLSGYSGYYPEVYDKMFFYLPKHGTYREVRSNEITFYSTWYFGVRNGVQTGWYEGEKFFDAYFRLGEPSGTWKHYLGSGSFCEGKCVKGSDQDYWYIQVPCSKLGIGFQNVKKIELWHYVDRNVISMDELYDDNGKRIKTVEYQNGKPVKTTLYKDGMPIEEKK